MMSTPAARKPWVIAQVQLATFLPIALGLGALFILAVGAITLGIDRFREIDGSVWDGAAQIPRWFAGAVGFFLIANFLPLMVAHGETRRNFMIETTPVIVFAAAVLAALIALGYALEGVFYRAMGWPQVVGGDRLFTAPDQFPLIFLTYWLQFAIWMIAGALLAVGNTGADEWNLVTIPAAIALVLVAGGAIGLNVLPFFGRLIPLVVLPLPLAIGICASAFLLGVAVTWALVRTMPIKIRTG